jgi:hypothetical protein
MLLFVVVCYLSFVLVVVAVDKCKEFFCVALLKTCLIFFSGEIVVYLIFFQFEVRFFILLIDLIQIAFRLQTLHIQVSNNVGTRQISHELWEDIFLLVMNHKI